MFDFLDYLNSIVLGDDGGSQTTATAVMQDFAQEQYGFNLTDEQIVHSVQEASDFFNMDSPAVIRDGWTTGVCTHLSFTESDDVLFINKHQMEAMGITGAEAFDLVMTHEGAHRALQGMDTGYTDHQEELCCDYMAGVRAALNDMPQEAIDVMKASLGSTAASETHPAGSQRVDSIDDGYKFTIGYMEQHGCAPSFSDCLKDFNSVHGIGEETGVKGLVTLRPEGAPEAVRTYSAEEIGARLYNLQEEIKNLQTQIRHVVPTGDEDLWQESDMSRIDALQDKLDAATREYQRWIDETPDRDIHGYTTSDIEWLEKQVRISSGSEQAHWLEKLKWATNHVSGFVAEETANMTDNASDFSADDSLHGFVNDKGWHLKQAEHEQKEVEYYRKRMEHALKDGKISTARDYEYQMKRHEKLMKSHVDDAQRSTKLFAAPSDVSFTGSIEGFVMPSFEELQNMGFSDHIAHGMLNPDMPHSYTQQELQTVLSSDNPLEAYNQMMDAKANVAMAKADALEARIARDFGIFATI